ncbi:MAG: MiaB/RimO family radical SAM methylthiotransferase [Gemmatimonadetes bacterium]|nr:MiaB/RimO family radical SAM methylthiotransferase [Gemmatimonadota bacterium]MDA1102836.1 MiaB/RimO family radical SAM methylthiotransferase [Gemmatimonadota bacterium]
MRVYYQTFGCKANQYDTERMRQESEARGAQTTEVRSEADLVVVNTCTVTNQADAEARRFIRRLRRESPETEVVVAGCSAALREPEYRAMPGVRSVVRGHDPVAVASVVVPDYFAQIELRTGLDRIDPEPIGGDLLRRRRGAARGWLKVQDGCDRKCSFCATRLARGVSRSRPVEEVVAEARLMSDAHAELVITGIHIGHYGIDLEGAYSLSRLCATLLDRVPGVRFRLGSIEATEVDDLMVDLLSTSDARLVPHLHMPLQSGADPVLRAMRRWHTREQYRTRVLEIAERVSPLGLGADVIAGFPGESDRDHASTRALIEELPFTYLHVFPFSPRTGTAAAELPDPVPQRIAGDRARELRDIAQRSAAAYRASRVGTPAGVVPEGDGRRGLTEDYLRVDIGDREERRERGVRPKPTGGLVRGTLRGDADHLYIETPRQTPLINA